MSISTLLPSLHMLALQMMLLLIAGSCTMQQSCSHISFTNALQFALKSKSSALVAMANKEKSARCSLSDSKLLLCLRMIPSRMLPLLAAGRPTTLHYCSHIILVGVMTCMQPRKSCACSGCTARACSHWPCFTAFLPALKGYLARHTPVLSAQHEH